MNKIERLAESISQQNDLINEALYSANMAIDKEQHGRLRNMIDVIAGLATNTGILCEELKMHTKDQKQTKCAAMTLNLGLLRKEINLVKSCLPAAVYQSMLDRIDIIQQDINYQCADANNDHWHDKIPVGGGC